jgi:hypothetical protein
MDITPCGAVKQPPTKAKSLKTLSPRKDYVSLTTVLIHIYILGMDLMFWICRGLWYSLISYRYYCFVNLQNWIGGISDHFRLKIKGRTTVRKTSNFGQPRQFSHLQGESSKNIETESAHFLAKFCF